MLLYFWQFFFSVDFTFIWIANEEFRDNNFFPLCARNVRGLNIDRNGYLECIFNLHPAINYESDRFCLFFFATSASRQQNVSISEIQRLFIYLTDVYRSHNVLWHTLCRTKKNLMRLIFICSHLLSHWTVLTDSISEQKFACCENTVRLFWRIIFLFFFYCCTNTQLIICTSADF